MQYTDRKSAELIAANAANDAKAEALIAEARERLAAFRARY